MQKKQNDANDFSPDEDELIHSVNISNHQTDVKQLFSYIDQKCHSIFPPWSNSLLFPANDEEGYDITKYCQECYKAGGDLKHISVKIYFCPKTYSTENGFEGEGFGQLTKDIQRASLASGFEVFKNGKYPAKKLGLRCIKFSCCKSRKYISQAKEHTLVTQVRKSTFHQDRKNSRGPSGKKMARRCSTKKPVSIMHTCKYFFLLHFDIDKGFYVVPGFGNMKHSHHPKFGDNNINLPPRLLDEVNKDFVGDMGDGHASNAIIRNILFLKTGKLVSRSNINYMKKTAHDVSENDKMRDMCNMSPTDIMLRKCQTKGYDYMVLFQDPCHGLLPRTELFSGLDGSKEETCLTGLSHSESKDINNYINTGRLSLRLDCHQKYMMAFAWVSPSERERFNLFPEIITVDTVLGTNNENRPLLTMGGKDSNCKMFIF